MFKLGIKVVVDMETNKYYHGKVGTICSDEHDVAYSLQGYVVEFDSGIKVEFLTENLKFASRSEEFLNWLPDDFVAKHRRGEYAEFIEDDMYAEWTPYYCDDCETWHKIASYHKWYTEGGVFKVDFMHIDQDGDSGISNGCDVDSDEYPEMEDEYFNSICKDNDWKDYFKWVAAEGKDPLGELLGIRTKEKTEFTIYTEINDGKVFIINAENKNSQEKYEYFTDNSHTTRSDKQLPKELAQFLYAEDCDLKGWRIAPPGEDGEIWTPDQIMAADEITWQSPVTEQFNIGTLVLDMDKTEGSLQEETKTEARKQIANYEKMNNELGV